MVDRRLFIIFFVVSILVSVLSAERARNDHLEADDDDDDQMDFSNDNSDDVIQAMKRFLKHKKSSTTTPKPSTDSIAALITTPKTILTGATKSPGFVVTTSRYGRTGATRGPTKDACGVINPCKNGGTCKTLSSGSYYCFCPQDYYGKTCENKFITTGSANKDRARTDHCAKSPCRNGGECIALRTTYYCRCKSPYYGINCDKRIGKREEIAEEFNSAEEDLIAYERDLEQDNEDLRRAINEQNFE